MVPSLESPAGVPHVRFATLCAMSTPPADQEEPEPPAGFFDSGPDSEDTEDSDAIVPGMTQADDPVRRVGLAAWILIVIATLLLPLGVIGFWSQQTLTDTDTFVETVAPLAEDPAIQQQVADQVAQSLTEAIDLDALAEEWFPRAPESLVSTMSGALEGLIQQLSQKVVESPEFAELFERVLRGAQSETMDILNNEGGVVKVEGEDIVLDLSEVRNKVNERLAERGIQIPDRGGDATIVIAQADSLSTAQSAYGVGQPVLQWFILLPLILLVIALVVAKDTARAVRAVGGAAIVAGAFLIMGWLMGSAIIASLVMGTQMVDVGPAAYDILAGRLMTWAWVLVILGLIILALGWWWVWRRSRPEPEEASV